LSSKDSLSATPNSQATRATAIEGVRSVVGTGAPEMNALVNPGAISATSMVTGGTADIVWKKILGIEGGTEKSGSRHTD
jgi:glutaminase